MQLQGNDASSASQTTDAASLTSLATAFTRLALAVENLVNNQPGVLNQESFPSLGQEDAGTSASTVATDTMAGNVIPASPPATLVTTSAPMPAITSISTDGPGINTVVPPVTSPASSTAISIMQPAVIAQAPSRPIPTLGIHFVPLGAPSIPTPDEVAERAKTLTSPNGRWYLVVAGKQVGVFANWDEVSPLVLKCPSATYRRLDDRDEAVKRYKVAYENGTVVVHH